MPSPLSALRKGELPQLAVYYAALIAEGLIVGGLGPSLADLARQTGTDLGGISLVLVMRPLGYLFGALACSVWLDHRPGHPILALACLACALALACVPLSGSLALVASLILVVGFFTSLLDVGSNTLIAWVLGKRLGPFLSGLHFSFGLGAFLGPMLVGWSLARHGHSVWAFWLIAILLLPLALAFRGVPSPAHHATEGEKRGAQALDRRMLACFVGLFFLYGGIESGFGSWIYQYAVSLRLAQAGPAALLTSLFWGLLGLGRLLGIPLLARVSPRQLLTALIPAALLSLILLLGCSGAVWALWLGTAGMGLGLSCVFPTMLVYAGERLTGSGRMSGRITGTLFVGSATGGMTLPWIMGQAFEPRGPKVALALVLAALAGLGSLFAWVCVRKARAETPRVPVVL